MRRAKALKDFPGAKGGEGVWQTIVSQMPPHQTYVELFLGRGTILRAKRTALQNHGVEVDPEVADAFPAPPLTKVWLADAITWIQETVWEAFPRPILVYADPPYLAELRANPARAYYRREFGTREQHLKLLFALRALLDHGVDYVMVSGYPCAFYDRVLEGWRQVLIPTVSRGGQPRIESLWTSFVQPRELHDYRWLGQGWRERDRIKRKKRRWVTKLRSMPIVERSALCQALEEVRLEER